MQGKATAACGFRDTKAALVLLRRLWLVTALVTRFTQIHSDAPIIIVFLLFDGPTLILARTAWSRGPTPNLKDLLKPSEANPRGYLEKCRFKVMPEGVPFGASETCKTSGKGKKPQAAKTRRNRKEHAVTIQVKAQTLRPQTSEASSQNMSIQRSVTRCIRNNFRHLSASQCGADTSQ